MQALYSVYIKKRKNQRCKEKYDANTDPHKMRVRSLHLSLRYYSSVGATWARKQLSGVTGTLR